VRPVFSFLLLELQHTPNPCLAVQDLIGDPSDPATNRRHRNTAMQPVSHPSPPLSLVGAKWCPSPCRVGAPWIEEELGQNLVVGLVSCAHCRPCRPNAGLTLRVAHHAHSGRAPTRSASWLWAAGQAVPSTSIRPEQAALHTVHLGQARFRPVGQDSNGNPFSIPFRFKFIFKLWKFISLYLELQKL
jgi:hypothetical protein